MNEYHYEGFIVKELNYFDYKNLVKKLLTTDIEVINVIFNELFNSCLISDKKYNALDKFKLIMKRTYYILLLNAKSKVILLT